MTTEVVGYTRLSEDGLSIPDQKRKIRDYCDRQDLELQRIFDDGEHASGYETDERPEYRELRSLVQDAAIDAIVVRDTGRIGRDFGERMRFILDCRDQGVGLHSVEDGMKDLSDPYKVVVETAQAAGDDVQKRREIERSIEAVERRQENGCYQGKVPMGLRFAADKCHLERDPEEWEAIEAIIERRERGEKVADVAADVGVSTATVSRVANRGIEWYEEKLTEYGA